MKGNLHSKEKYAKRSNSRYQDKIHPEHISGVQNRVEGSYRKPSKSRRVPECIQIDDSDSQIPSEQQFNYQKQTDSDFVSGDQRQMPEKRNFVQPKNALPSRHPLSPTRLNATRRSPSVPPFILRQVKIINFLPKFSYNL